ncbi:MAG: hypothetical protein NC132_04555 [Corallococcus sp.]|nr:hypothetical protein [Corallococcus sp.]MCM1359657.1 hypothetical protein [Corallococcus sp.]MCM1395366.1 hypothetical protein [Corallococcus sp.]
MRYQSKSTISYVMRNFWRLMPWTFAVAVLSGFFLTDQPVIDFVHGYAAGEITLQNFLQNLANAVTVLRFGKYWWCALITVLLFVFAECVLLVKVARHMRIGEMQRFPLRSAVSVLPRALLFTLGVALFLELLNLAVVGIAYLIRPAGLIASTVICAILLFAVKAITVFGASALLLAFPIMFEENYRFTSALSYSVRLALDKRNFLIAVSLIYPLLQLALTALCAWVDLRALTVALYSLFFFAFSLYAPCVAFKIYYDSVGGVRRDIVRVMFN